VAPKFHKIITYSQLQPDTICAIILLKKFGEKKYPGISKAVIEYMIELPKGKTADSLEREGILCIDLGGGRFDHHRQTRMQERFCATDLVAKDLGIDTNPGLEKIITYARRDDLEGKGIISKDSIDRAFGLSALIQNLNRHYIGHPEKVLATIAPLLLAHLKEEQKRAHEYPEEYRKKWDEGKIDAFIVNQGEKQIRVVLIESDIFGMAGFLRAHPEIKADVVAQRFASGHTNIITRQERRLNLKEVAAILRTEELKAKKYPFDRVNWRGLYNKGKMREVPEWYYDTAANTIQNGGMLAEQTKPTQLSLLDIKRALKVGLDFSALDPKCPQKFCLGKKCRFYFYNLIRCRKIRELGGIAKVKFNGETTVWSEKVEEPKKEKKKVSDKKGKAAKTKKASPKKEERKIKKKSTKK